MHPTVDRWLAPLDRLIATPIVWSLLEKTMIRIARGLQRRRDSVHLERLRRQLSQNSEVQAGPFKGMKYALHEAACSAIFPKLLGTYELELASAMDYILCQKYDCIIDVGCAEGYYAVGLAIRHDKTPVIAFDIDEKARELCLRNAQVNDVDSRIEIRAGATPRELTKLCSGKRALIICDCEGYEEDLLLNIEVEELSRCDMLVETHDFIRPMVHKRIMERFSQSHRCLQFHSIDDQQKGKHYLSEWTNNMDIQLRKQVYAECRPVIMQWLFFESLSQASI